MAYKNQIRIWIGNGISECQAMADEGNEKDYHHHHDHDDVDEKEEEFHLSSVNT